MILSVANPARDRTRYYQHVLHEVRMSGSLVVFSISLARARLPAKYAYYRSLSIGTRFFFDWKGGDEKTYKISRILDAVRKNNIFQ